MHVTGVSAFYWYPARRNNIPAWSMEPPRLPRLCLACIWLQAIIIALILATQKNDHP